MSADATEHAGDNRAMRAFLLATLIAGVGFNARLFGGAPLFTIHVAIALLLGWALFVAVLKGALGAPVASRAPALLTVLLLLAATVWGAGETFFVDAYFKLAIIFGSFYGFLLLFSNWPMRVGVVLGALSVGALVATTRRLGVSGIVTRLAAISIETRVGADEFGGNNAYAFFLAIAIVGFLYLAVSARRRAVRLLCLAPVPYLFLHLLATLSRGGMLALLIGVGTFYAAQSRSPVRALVATASGAALVGLVVLLVVPDLTAVRDRFDVTSDPTGSGRTGIWSALLSELAEAPAGFLVGKGTGSIDIETPWARLESAHSTYLEMLFQYGVIGLTLALLLAARLVRGVLALPRSPERAAILAVTLQVVLGSTIDSYHGTVQVGWVYGYWLAFVWSVIRPVPVPVPAAAAAGVPRVTTT
jgi:O-antigen ligase